MSRFHSRWRTFALIGAASTGCVVTHAWAEPAPPYAQLLQQAANSPRVEALDADVARAEGLARQAEVRPNPTVSVMAENFAGGPPFGSYNRAETTVQYAQPIEIGGKRSARIAYGTAGVAAAKAHNHAGRVNYAYELALAYADVEIAERRVGLVEDEIEEASEDLRIARAMVAAGKDSHLRQLQAETELNTLEADLQAAKALRTGALARLSALAGSEAPFTGVGESLLGRLAAPAVMGPPDHLTNPVWLAADADRKAAEARVRAEQRRGNPDVTVILGARRLEAEGSTAMVAGLSVPLPLFDRNRGNIAAAEAEHRGAEARERAAQLEARAAQNAAQANVGAAQGQVLAAQTSLASAQEAYRLSHIAYQGGKIPLSEVLAARRGLGKARGAVLDAETARFKATAQAAALAGYSIAGDQIP